MQQLQAVTLRSSSKVSNLSAPICWASRHFHPCGSPRAFSSFQQFCTYTGMDLNSQQSMGNHRATALRTDCKVHLHFLRPFQSFLIGQIEVLGHGLGRRPGHCQSLFKHWRALIQSHNHYYFSLCSLRVVIWTHSL